MKPKDIFLVMICLLVIGGSIYLGIRILKPPSKPASSGPTTGSVSENEKFTGEIDENTFGEIEKLKDYGVPDQNNIGRPEPFAGI